MVESKQSASSGLKTFLLDGGSNRTIIREEFSSDGVTESLTNANGEATLTTKSNRDFIFNGGIAVGGINANSSLKFSNNILSESALLPRGMSIIKTPNEQFIYNGIPKFSLPENRKIKLTEKNGHYYVQANVLSGSTNNSNAGRVNASNGEINAEENNGFNTADLDIPNTMGHDVSPQDMLKHQRLMHLNGPSSVKISECESCVIGKGRRKSHKKKRPAEKTEPYKKAHLDLIGPFEVPALDGQRRNIKYVLNLVEDCWGDMYPVGIKDKSEAYLAIEKLKSGLDEQEWRFSLLRSDDGGEFQSHEFKKACQPSALHLVDRDSPEKNGKVERGNRQLLEFARSNTSKSNRCLWLLSMQAGAHIKRLLRKIETGERDASDVDRLRRFGCYCRYRAKSKEVSGKLTEKWLPGIHVGYNGRHGYRVLNLNAAVINSDDVFFDESRIVNVNKFLSGKMVFPESDNILEVPQAVQEQQQQIENDSLAKSEIVVLGVENNNSAPAQNNSPKTQAPSPNNSKENSEHKTDGSKVTGDAAPSDSKIGEPVLIPDDSKRFESKPANFSIATPASPAKNANKRVDTDEIFRSRTESEVARSEEYNNWERKYDYLSAFFENDGIASELNNEARKLVLDEQEEKAQHNVNFIKGSEFLAEENDVNLITYNEKTATTGPKAPFFLKAEEKEKSQFDSDVIEEKSYDDLPPGVTPIPMHLVWQEKDAENADENVVSDASATENQSDPNCKVRSVLLGDREEISKEEEPDIFSPVTANENLRMMIAYALQTRKFVRSFDIKGAFLRTPMQEGDEYWVIPPARWRKSSKYGNKTLWRLKSWVYGLKKSGRKFYEYLAKILKSQGWNASVVDPGVFWRKDYIPDGATEPECEVLLLYVDDGLLCCCTPERSTFFANQILSSFKGGTLKSSKTFKFLGQEFQWGEDEVVITQTEMIENLAKRFNITASKKTPVNAITKPSQTKAEKTKKKRGKVKPAVPTFREASGSIQYLATCVRPDVAWSACELAKHNDLAEQPWDMVERTISYLYGTKSRGLRFVRDKSESGKFSWSKALSCYSDADWRSPRSTSGWMICFNGRPFQWKSSTQKSPALSSTESEIVSFSNCCRALKAAGKLILEIFGEKLIEVPFYVDNTSTIEVNKQYFTTMRLRHLDLAYHFLRHENLYTRLVDLKYIESKHQRADGFTKPSTEKVLANIF